MIQLYTWGTPNGRKASIALEELGLPHAMHAIDIAKDEQFAPDFFKIAAKRGPTRKIELYFRTSLISCLQNTSTLTL